jgi:SAM-dependent methyltransferase
MREWDAESARLAARALAAGRPTAWFEELYAAGARAEITMPWDRARPAPLLADWLSGSGEGRTAVVVGCGLGADAEFVAGHGFATTAFDISATAIRTARQRHPTSQVRYRTADLLALPDGWAFDLVVEIINVQALPVSLRAEAVAAAAGWSRRAARCWSSRTCAPGRSPSALRGPSPGRRSPRSPTTGSTR